MASNNNMNPYTHMNASTSSGSNFISTNSSIHPQAVYLSYNNNQYPTPETSSSPYVLPVTIINNDNFLFYNNSNESNVEIDQCKEDVPQYIVTLDSSNKSIDPSSPGITTINVQGTDKIQDIYKKYPLLNKLVVKKIYTRNLLNLPVAFQELDRLHGIEENKRKQIRLVLKEPKKERETYSRISGDESLKKYVYSNKPFERMTPNLFKKVSIRSNNVVDCIEEPHKHVVDDFIQKRCKAFVADEINGIIEEDDKILVAKTKSNKLKTESSFSQPDAGSIYPWRNPSLGCDVDLDANATKISDPGDTLDSNNSSQQPISVLPWRNKQTFSKEFPESVVFDMKPPTNSVVSNNEQNQTHSKVQSNVEVIQIDSTKLKQESDNAPKFFRSKKLGYMEDKKRTYVNQELNQLRTDKKPLNSPLKTIYGGGPKRRKKIINEDEDFDDGYNINKFQENNDNFRASTSLNKTKPKDFLTSEEKSACLDFFNKSSLNELALMPGCSIKKAEEIISLRPYRSLPDLCSKISNSAQLNDNLVDSCQEVLNMRNMLSKLIMKCERMKLRFEKILSNNFEDKQVELPIERIETQNLISQQPQCLNNSLRLTSYQMVGLNWLNLLHHEKVNGILADEMGLGKTVQTIAFLAYLWESTGDTGPHLIVVPSSTLGVWQRELQIWCPQLQVVLYHGNKEDRKKIRLKIYEGKSFQFNILLTNYNISNGTMEDRALLKRVNFHYGVFDEAHLLKNMLTSRYKNLINFKVRRRLLLTGTPIQNNLLELISLLTFVMPDLFLPHIDFLKKLFQTNTLKNENEGNNENFGISEFDQKKIDQSKDLLKPFCLRRLKEQVLSQLPEKSIHVEYLPLLDHQRNIYDSLLNEIKQSLETNDKSNQYQFSYVMNLRKVSNHPLLIRNHYHNQMLQEIAHKLMLDKNHGHAKLDAILDDLMYMNDFQIHITCQLYSETIGQYSLSDELIVQSNKINFYNENLTKFIDKGHRILIFSQFTMMLDILEAYLNISQLSFLRLDGQTPVTERQDLIDKFNVDESIKIFILSTKAGGLGINLTGADIVIINDIDFNPFNDKQAEDRCHRLGQTKNVQIIKLISKQTIEEGILNIATSKLKLDAPVSASYQHTNDNESISFSDKKPQLEDKLDDDSDAVDNKNIDDNIDPNINDIEQLIKQSIS